VLLIETCKFRLGKGPMELPSSRESLEVDRDNIGLDPALVLTDGAGEGARHSGSEELNPTLVPKDSAWPL